MKTKRNRHITDVSIRELKVKFLLYHLRYKVINLFRRSLLTLLAFFTESFDCVKRKEWKWLVRIQFERLRGESWEIKCIFFILILDIYHYDAYKEWDDKIFPAHFGVRLWFNSWKIVKIWGSCGTNCAEIFHWCSTKRIYQTQLFKQLNPIRALKKVVILQRIEEMRDLYNSICDDPMNGCPEDFAEDGCRIENQLWGTYYAL